jgi:hypothetical protein
MVGRSATVACGVALLMVLVLGATRSVAIADVAHTGGKDSLVGNASGIAMHPVFGLLPFTDRTVGQSDGVAASAVASSPSTSLVSD